MTFAEVERTNQREKRLVNMPFLNIDFQRITARGRDVAVVYFEKNGAAENKADAVGSSDLIRVADYDIMNGNPVEAKYHRLARSSRAG